MQHNQPIRVDVVADDPDHVMIIQRAFQAIEQPTGIETINDGATALAALQPACVHPDLILLDINMIGL